MELQDNILLYDQYDEEDENFDDEELSEEQEEIVEHHTYSFKKNNIETIYYADIHKLKLSSIKEELYSKLSQYLHEDNEGEKVLAVPGVYFLVDGEIVCNHTGTVESYHNPYNKMTKEQQEELLDIYDKCIKEMK